MQARATIPHVLFALCAGLVGCGTTRSTDTLRSATEQLLVSNAVDRSINQMDFRFLAGKTVFFDQQYLDGTVDKGYLVSAIRQHLLACGCILLEDRTKATYVVEARAGAVGTDRHQLLFGVPQMNLPAFSTYQPTLVPEIPFVKRTDQLGVAKIAAFAFNRETGTAIWQSGNLQYSSKAKDTWYFGLGPVQRGTIREGTEFAGEQLTLPLVLPLLSSNAPESKDPSTAVKVGQPAMWSQEPAAPTPEPARITGQPVQGQPTSLPKSAPEAPGPR